MQVSDAGSTSRDLPWHALPTEDVFGAVKSCEDGLDAGEVEVRQRDHGRNVVPRVGGVGIGRLVVRQIANPIVYLLFASAVLAVLLGKVLDGMVVLGAILVNAIVGFIQELKAGRAIESLSRMVPQNAVVIRGRIQQSIPAADLVPGDVVMLASGDRVPADVRLLTAKSLCVDEASLTGESTPVQKTTSPVAEATVLADRSSMAFGGTLVASGTARAVVTATGGATELGRISRLLQAATDLETPLTKAIASVGVWLTIVVALISLVLLGVGLARGYELSDAVLVAITLAVACIPEGLPAIITIALAIGVQRMAKRNAVVRRLPSVETLGSTTVICSDKTGTLTRNEMTVQAVVTTEAHYALGGVGYAPEGTLSSEGTVLSSTPAGVTRLLTAAALCNDATISRDRDTWVLSGDPTEGALVVAAAKVGLDVAELRRRWSRVDVIPFDAERQFMATLHGDGVAYVKGAPEALLQRCLVSDDRRDETLRLVSQLASRGMRVLAIAEKPLGAGVSALEDADVATGLSLLGIVGMIDPPRPEAIEAVARCHAAGIGVKMITGDHLGTAEAIAQQLRLDEVGVRGLSGTQLASLDDEALREAARTNNVFARVAPEHKLRLVRALQADGNVVGMTGDGVNDAPALKQANIGIAMGITGTAVAKEAADIVLADDNFATIVAAVEGGRRIYDNLIKSLAFVLPTNLGLGLILVVAVAAFPIVTIAGELVPLMPALPTQLLWINLVSTVALSLPLAMEVAEPDVMSRRPRPIGAPILDRFIIVRTAIVAIAMAAGALGLFLWEYHREVGPHGSALAMREAQTMAVTTVVVSQIFYLLHCRSLRSSIREVGIASNPTVFIGIAAMLVLHGAFIYVPLMQDIFQSAPLGLEALALCALVGATIIPIVSLEKRLLRQRAPRQRAPT